MQVRVLPKDWDSFGLVELLSQDGIATGSEDATSGSEILCGTSVLHAGTRVTFEMGGNHHFSAYSTTCCYPSNLYRLYLLHQYTLLGVTLLYVQFITPLSHTWSPFIYRHILIRWPLFHTDHKHDIIVIAHLDFLYLSKVLLSLPWLINLGFRSPIPYIEVFWKFSSLRNELMQVSLFFHMRHFALLT